MVFRLDEQQFDRFEIILRVIRIRPEPSESDEKKILSRSLAKSKQCS